MRKSQSAVEFIVVAIAFIILVYYASSALLTRVSPELNKIKEQTACFQADSLANLILREPGEPANWNRTTITTFALTNGSQFYISYNKWNDTKALGYASVFNRTRLNTSFHLSYQAYALPWNITAPTGCAKLKDSTARFCLRNVSTLALDMNSTDTATFSAKLYLPFADSVAFITSNTDPGDAYNYKSDANGTTIDITFNTNKTDANDSIMITPSVSPKMIFIKYLNYEGRSRNYPVYFNNTIIKDDFGSTGYLSAKNAYCEIERRLLLVPNETIRPIPVQFDILAW